MTVKRLLNACSWRLARERLRIWRLVGYVYGAWLTLRYVDSWSVFPAVAFQGKVVRLKILKASHARWVMRVQLHFMPPLRAGAWSVFSLDNGATLTIERNFKMGAGVHLRLSRNAKLVIGGADQEPEAGMNGGSVLVAREVTIGQDCVIAAGTYITDWDWHTRDDVEPVRPTHIDRHVWIATGSYVLKGSQIGRDSIVGANTVVAGGKFPPRSLIAGSPATVIRSEIADWHETLSL